MLKKITRWCDEHKMSIRAFEIACNLSNGTVGKWDNSNPSLESIKKISEYTGISIDEWLKKE